jgi:hypothetical protein
MDVMLRWKQKFMKTITEANNFINKNKDLVLQDISLQL